MGMPIYIHQSPLMTLIYTYIIMANVELSSEESETGQERMFGKKPLIYV
jgi:hypothetical protein